MFHPSRHARPAPGRAAGLLPTPAPGDHRNALFHDFHVARVQVIIVQVPVTPPPKTPNA